MDSQWRKTAPLAKVFVFIELVDDCTKFRNETQSDVDECAAGNMCQNGECDNTMGSYKCRCEDGYSVKPDEGPGCTDDDECLMGSHTCDPNAECNNTVGGHECKCRDGFTGNGQMCRDINECLTNNGGCDQDAQCINTDGSFKVSELSNVIHFQFLMTCADVVRLRRRLQREWPRLS